MNTLIVIVYILNENINVCMYNIANTSLGIWIMLVDSTERPMNGIRN